MGFFLTGRGRNFFGVAAWPDPSGFGALLSSDLLVVVPLSGSGMVRFVVGPPSASTVRCGRYDPPCHLPLRFGAGRGCEADWIRDCFRRRVAASVRDRAIRRDDLGLVVCHAVMVPGAPRCRPATGALCARGCISCRCAVRCGRLLVSRAHSAVLFWARAYPWPALVHGTLRPMYTGTGTRGDARCVRGQRSADRAHLYFRFHVVVDWRGGAHFCS